MTSWEPGCCHPTGGPHGKGEPKTCCHIHVEDLPSNETNQQGEPPAGTSGWTAQEQAKEDAVAMLRAEAREDWTTIVQRHQHRV